MTIQPGGPAGAVLHFATGELGNAAPTEGQLLRLVRRACRRVGLFLEEPLKIELYESAAGALVFVREEGRLWRFESTEALLAAAQALDEREEGGSLYAGQGFFWLALSPRQRTTQHRLLEFSEGRGVRELPRRALLLSQDALKLLREQGQAHSGSMT
ncbi:MAG: hypothetical protein LUF80_06625 [Oscillospiraceae bacterium]|nr:hypothetical protein [Oscillospiraceae bacterium]